MAPFAEMSDWRRSVGAAMVDADEAGEIAGECSEFEGDGVLDDLPWVAFGTAGWVEVVDVVGEVVRRVFAR